MSLFQHVHERAIVCHQCVNVEASINTLRQKLVHPKDRTQRYKQSNAVYVVQCSQDGKDCALGKQNNFCKWIGTTSEGQLQKSRLCCPLTSEGINHSFEDNNVNILAREDRWFERGVKESIHVRLWTEEVAFSVTYHPPTVLHWVPSPDSLSTIHTWAHLAIATHMKAGWAFMWVKLGAHTCPHRLCKDTPTQCLKASQLPSSWLEMNKSLGWEVKRLQETETRPVAYDTALKIYHDLDDGEPSSTEADTHT